MKEQKMKKLMFALAAVAMAASVQAATVTWSLDNVYAGNDTDKASGIAFLLNANTAFDSSTWTDAASALAWLNANALGQGGTAFTWQGSDGNYGMQTAIDPAKLGLTADGTTSYKLYAVVFDTETVTDDSNYFVSDAMNRGKKIANASTNTPFDLPDAGDRSKIAGNWTAVAVPEPTSGLLLLLGVAGLALRRRRA